MANEQRIDTLYGLVWKRSTPDVLRVNALYGLVWRRPTPDILRVDAAYGLVWRRIVRTWGDIPGATKVDFPGGLTDPDEKGYFRARFTIGTGKITLGILQVVADYRARISLNGEGDIFPAYQAGDTHAQVETYNVPPSKFLVGENLLAFEVAPEVGRLEIMLEFRLDVYGFPDD
jgi:hypothetical protein